MALKVTKDPMGKKRRNRGPSPGEQREQDLERATPTHRSPKKNTRLYCKGNPKHPHDPEWRDLGFEWTMPSTGQRRHFARWTLVCKGCGKYLGHVWRLGGTKVVVDRGFEAFAGGPPETEEKR